MGNDVIIGGTGNDDYDSESGDDILVSGDGIVATNDNGVERFEGQLGFDWMTTARDTVSNDSDMLFNLAFIPDSPEEQLRDRFDRVEALSGWDLDDILAGDNTTTVELAADAVLTQEGIQNNALNSQAQISLINGLQGLLDGMLGDADPNTLGFQSQTSFSSGNILLGGDGNDSIEGRGGNDLIDGDKWLNVQISYVDANNVEHRVNTMEEIQAQLFDGTINPGQLKIVREIVQADGTGDIDTAVYNDIATNYTFSVIPDAGTGTWTITDAQPLVAGPLTDPNAPFAPPIDEGTDTLRNVERLRFNNGAGGFVFVDLNPNAANVAATGDIIISNNAPTEDQALTVSGINLFDTNGMVNLSTLQFHWEAETATGNWTRVLSNSATYTPGNAQAGQALRVIATFEDNLGHQESLTSPVTAPVLNVDDAPISVDTEVIIVEDGSHTFSAADFGFSDPDDGDSFGSVVINSLPATGSLTFNNVTVVAGAIIAANQLGSLVYTPAANANGADIASLDFTVRDSDGTPAIEPSTIWFSVNADNDAPSGANNTVTTNEDATYTFAKADFGFTDLDVGDELRAVRIDSLPLAGILTLNGNLVVASALILAPDIAAGNLKFTPVADENGFGVPNSEYANFTFSVQDLALAFGTPNTMTVNVNQVNDAATGGLEISDLAPTEGTAITANQLVPAIADVDGLGTFTYQWESSANGVDGLDHCCGCKHSDVQSHTSRGQPLPAGKRQLYRWRW